jgi:uncharacterized membrane protein YdjX (TVP38/TMEM64 family)
VSIAVGAVPSPSRALKITAVVMVAGVLLMAHRLGILAQFAEPSRAARTLNELGAVGYLAFVIAYAVLQPFGVPGTVFIIAAPLIWPWPVAFALSMTGTMAASVVGFAFARFVARDWISAKIPARFKKYDDALARRAFTTVFVLRLVFWMPPMLHAFFGVSPVRFWTHFWGSLAGYVLPLLVVSYFGQPLFDAVTSVPPAVWIGAGAFVAAAVLVAWAVRRRALRPAARVIPD